MEKKGFNIDNVFCPERNKIIIEGENVTAKRHLFEVKEREN